MSVAAPLRGRPMCTVRCRRNVNRASLCGIRAVIRCMFAGILLIGT